MARRYGKGKGTFLCSSAGRRITCFVVVCLLIETGLRYNMVEDVHVWNLPLKLKGFLRIGQPCNMKPERSRQLIEVLFAFASWAESARLRYWIDYGTLLGADRNGKLIPWDWDVDAGLMKDEIESIPDVKTLLKRKGLTMKRQTTCRLAICLQSSNSTCVDIFMHVIRKSDNFVIRCELEDVFRYHFPASLINPTKPIKFEGRMLQGPNDPPEMLKKWRYPYSYGWEVPYKAGCYFTAWSHFRLFLTFSIIPLLLVVLAICCCCSKL
ncbi:ribitol 5-phosphate transferase FKRP-like [Corticium candelabrum]|uniref:ribitol 5-phosphate transferase FKRP-like n=1 Tax=Corticium candelabrum TaxID=121492 RepID=UPI002E26BDC4|nr:ribitol 5-phosphate transferase FKRP-like [Corticium candelabrum]